MKFRAVKNKEFGDDYWLVQGKKWWWLLWKATPYRYCRTKQDAQQLCDKFMKEGYFGL